MECPACCNEIESGVEICECGARLSEYGQDPFALPVGTKLQEGELVILGYIGRGGSAISYRARSTRFKKIVAIKELLPTDNTLLYRANGKEVLVGSEKEAAERLRERFKSESKHLLDLEHEHMVKYLFHFSENGTEYLVMSYVEGETLADYISREGVMKSAKAWEFLQDILDAVSYLHQKKLIHRDIKPENVMIRRKDGKPVLIDFGLV